MKGNETLPQAARRIIGTTPEPLSWEEHTGLARLPKAYEPHKALFPGAEQESMSCGQMKVDLGVFQSCTFWSPDTEQSNNGLYDLRIQPTVYINKSEVVRRIAQGKGVTLTSSEVETIARELGGGDRWLANKDVATTGNPMELVQKDSDIVLDWVPDNVLSLPPQEVMDALVQSVYQADYQPLEATPEPISTSTPPAAIQGASATVDLVPPPTPQGTGLVARPTQTPESLISPLFDPKLLYGAPLGLFVTLLGTLAVKQLIGFAKDTARVFRQRSLVPVKHKPKPPEAMRSTKITKPQSILQLRIDALVDKTPAEITAMNGSVEDKVWRGAIAAEIASKPEEYPLQESTSPRHTRITGTHVNAGSTGPRMVVPETTLREATRNILKNPEKVQEIKKKIQFLK